jgi:hypothetical protein
MILFLLISPRPLGSLSFCFLPLRVTSWLMTHDVCPSYIILKFDFLDARRRNRKFRDSNSSSLINPSSEFKPKSSLEWSPIDLIKYSFNSVTLSSICIIIWIKNVFMNELNSKQIHVHWNYVLCMYYKIQISLTL